MQTEFEITPAEALAIEIAGRPYKEEFRDRVTVGTHPIDFNINIRGAIEIKEDGKSVRTVRPDMTTLLALVLAGVPRDKRESHLKTIVRAFEKAGELTEPAKANLEASQELIEALTTKEEVPRKGSTSGSLIVTKL